METTSKTNYKEKDVLRQLQTALNRTILGIEFLKCDIKDLETSVKKQSINATPR